MRCVCGITLQSLVLLLPFLVLACVTCLLGCWIVFLVHLLFCRVAFGFNTGTSANMVGTDAIIGKFNPPSVTEYHISGAYICYCQYRMFSLWHGPKAGMKRTGVAASVAGDVSAEHCLQCEACELTGVAHAAFN